MEVENINREIDMQTKDYESDGTAAIEVNPGSVKQIEVENTEDKVEDKVVEIKTAEEEKKPIAKSGFRYGAYLFFKRAFDIVASGLVLLVFSWLYIILAIVVMCSDGGKVIYKHKLVGKNRKPIFVSKFRSMKKNADKLEDMLTPEQLEQYKREFKIDNDPRITKVGNFLRKTSMDELPQVWDIFVGRISVVAPRPLMEEKVTKNTVKMAISCCL